MPFKSQAQRRKFAQLLVEGKITNDTFEEWNRETGTKKTARARRGDQEDVKKKRVTKVITDSRLAPRPQNPIITPVNH